MTTGISVQKAIVPLIGSGIPGGGIALNYFSSCTDLTHIQYSTEVQGYEQDPVKEE
jgi:hypothetical protein